LIIFIHLCKSYNAFIVAIILEKKKEPEETFPADHANHHKTKTVPVS